MAKRQTKSLHERIVEAETKSGRYLADANASMEIGAKIAADRLYSLSQVWLDKANALIERSERVR